MAMGEESAEATTGVGEGPLENADNVLVLSPTMDGVARESYFETVFPDHPAGYDVLAIDYRQTPAQWVEEWKRNVGESPRSCVVVSVDETRGSAAASASPSTVPPGRTAATTVEDPSDLTGLGITVSEYLSEHSGPRAFVTFDSLTVLLQYVDLQRAFRFLHVLTNRVATTDALAHYHMDPAAHSEREIATLASLFDVVAEFEDGEWTVRSR